MKNTIFLIPLTFIAWQSFAKITDNRDDYLPNPVPAAKHKFTVIAHRGDHTVYPENTLAAYAQAIKDGADYVEIDLRTTKDGQLVSLHNESVDRMTNGKGLVKDLMMTEIEKLKINSTDETQKLKIPTFKQILQLCKNKIYLYIDFKEADPTIVTPLLREYGMENQVLVYINNPEQFAAWRKAAPKTPLLLSLPDNVKDSLAMITFINQYKPDALDGDFKQYDHHLLAAAKSRHLPVRPDGQSKAEGPAVWDEVILKGLDGLQTDHPKDLIDYLKQKGLR